jgi:hypothetical protein
MIVSAIRLVNRNAGRTGRTGLGVIEYSLRNVVAIGSCSVAVDGRRSGLNCQVQRTQTHFHTVVSTVTVIFRMSSALSSYFRGLLLEFYSCLEQAFSMLASSRVPSFDGKVPVSCRDSHSCLPSRHVITIIIFAHSQLVVIVTIVTALVVHHVRPLALSTSSRRSALTAKLSSFLILLVVVARPPRRIRFLRPTAAAGGATVAAMLTCPLATQESSSKSARLRVVPAL